VINTLLILSAVADFFLAAFILFKTKKSSKGRVFAYCCVAFGLWTTFIILFTNTTNVGNAYFYSQFMKITSGLIASTFLHFVLNITGRRLKLYQKALIHLPVLLLFIGLQVPGLFIAEIRVHEWGNESVSGPLYSIFSLYILTYIFTGIYLIYTKSLVTKGMERIRLTYFLWTSIITSAVGLYFNLYLVLAGNYKYVWVGPYNSLIMCALITFSILKANLLDIKVVATRGFSRLMVLLLMGISVVVILNVGLKTQSFSLLSLSIIVLCYFWILYGERLRLLIQTPLEKAFLVNSYKITSVLNAINHELATTISMEEALNILINILKRDMEISEIELQDTAPTSRDPFILIEHDDVSYYLVFGKKLSEDPYNNKDLSLISAVEAQLKIIQDRISKVGIILKNERKIQSLERQKQHAKRISELSKMIQEYSHEIKTPQTALLQYIDLIDHNDISQMSEKNWTEIKEKVKGYIDRTVDAINETLLLTPRQTFPDLDTINFNDCIDDVLINYQDLPYEITVKKGTLKTLSGVKGEMKLILNNVIKNAIDAFQESGQTDGKICVETCMSGAYVKIRVSDNGPGILEEELDKIWTPYNTSKKSTGTGLGLSTVQARVLGYGGTIVAESDIGKGTAFTIMLPHNQD